MQALLVAALVLVGPRSVLTALLFIARLVEIVVLAAVSFAFSVATLFATALAVLAFAFAFAVTLVLAGALVAVLVQRIERALFKHRVRGVCVVA